MTFHHLRYLLQLLNHIVERSRVLQIESDVSARLVTKHLWVDDKLRPFEHTKIGELLYALMNSCTTHVAQACHFKKWYTSVFSYQL